ncbi:MULTISPECIES: disulfide oxidoreductase [Exiguobacterium]|jgi:disulfide bond formation protein DsbB|uniref:Thiol-disulfide oxidoreductase C n=2 Tax=Exiguobacterium TaxID=33986 RepID=A0A377HID0_9BACL|nr:MULTISPECIES: disulfide oxidoreductase [Exiguobacterium]KGI83889.1 2-oxoglutarate dehydrogenase [Exiguobacterium mexicanum]MCT4784361.1 disulfide oxidoreductase [Exiguobacterium himgiriensis]MDL5376254.1 disulfide oxidoreductase [Exiguobacterium mexicanum]RHB45812.1 disulfide bond formation protein B [Exiguobacterium sp. AM39-5BH]TCI66641.1 disulfide bond formation protein B [Exiguobacterium sp. IPCI3]
MSASVINRYGLYLAWVVSITAVLGSLYFSEIRGFIPCELCWIQRIFMYPIALILAIAVFREDSSIKFYVLPLSIIGFCISFYHYLVQKVPGFSEVRPCEQGVSCNAQYIDWMGFITIPFLALTAFFLITVILGRISTKQ